MTPDTDVLFGDRYLLTDRIAGGGMGEVWTATDQVLGRDVAVKVLRREYADDPTFLQRFRAEARHTALLSHQGIAAVFDYGEDDGSPYLVMELVRGEPLSSLIMRDGAMTPEQVLDVVAQSAFALQVAHDAGLIHRDIKPGNLLRTPDGTVKITDFGIARATDSVPLTQTGSIMGTANYISPEQASGTSVTPASDIYSLGVVAYECLAGRRPFDGNTPVSVALAQVREEPPALPADIPGPIVALVMRMLAKDPAARPASAGDVGREAQALLASGTPLAATPQTRTMKAPLDTDATRQVASPSRPTSRVRVPWVVALAVLAVLLVLLVRACATEATSPDNAGNAGGAGSSGSASPTRSATTQAATSVLVSAADYVGQPVAEARAALVADGLRVDVVAAGKGAERPVGTVEDVSPTGELERGSLVTLSFVGETTEQEPDDGEKDEKKGDDDEKADDEPGESKKNRPGSG